MTLDEFLKQTEGMDDEDRAILIIANILRGA